MREIPAFPTPEFFDEKVCGMTPGMTLRDWFAGQALAALLVDDEMLWEHCAELAYRAADAMMKARTKGCT